MTRLINRGMAPEGLQKYSAFIKAADVLDSMATELQKELRLFNTKNEDPKQIMSAEWFLCLSTLSTYLHTFEELAERLKGIRMISEEVIRKKNEEDAGAN